MTDHEWLSSNDPDQMLEFLAGKATSRKLRLFACACCRRIWDMLSDERSRKAVEVNELFADGLATLKDLATSSQKAREVEVNEEQELTWGPSFTHLAARTVVQALTVELGIAAAREVAKQTRQLMWYGERMRQCNWLRDLFGNLHPMILDSAYFPWSGGTIAKLAQAIYVERRYDDLPVLADALQEAGCYNEEILIHCRAAGDHIRGCWVVDLLLHNPEQFSTLPQPARGSQRSRKDSTRR